MGGSRGRESRGEGAPAAAVGRASRDHDRAIPDAAEEELPRQPPRRGNFVGGMR